MKKLVVLAASILLCTLAQAQEGSDPGTSAGFTIIPRIDCNPTFYDGSFDEVTLGNSSLYTLFEGNITDNLSFSVSNHWLSDKPKYLYKNAWHADDSNWCDWAYLEYAPGNFSISAGKDLLLSGGFEYDSYDYDVHPDMMSGLWSNMAGYQLGGKVGYMNSSESTGLFLQAASSPYGERPFNRMSWSMLYQGNYGPLGINYSTNLIENWDKGYEWMVTLSHSLELEEWNLWLDVFNKVGDPMFILRDGVTAFSTAQYNPSEKWEFLARCGFEHVSDSIDPEDYGFDLDEFPDNNSWTLGAAAHWFPLRNSKDLRLHAACSYNSGYEMLSFTVGAIFYLTFSR